ncbi:MAG TPA: hypothetical protein VKJ45_17655 [Blastocatellia bacterium]|nr:hypothetical protein [Blastocatellia bacterium]
MSEATRISGSYCELRGTLGGVGRVFRVGVGSAAHAKYQFQVGDSVEGVGHRVADTRLEIADIYKASQLRVSRGGPVVVSCAPWHGVPPPLPVYRQRGHRRLAATTYDARCQSCLWGCVMPVEIILDQWNPGPRRYRTETFCYGPLSCSVYKPGATRKVPGRRGMTYEEPDWVDQNETSHRTPDE